MSAGKKILIINNDQSAIHSFQSHVTELGISIKTARDWEQAWEKLNQEKLDAILLNGKLDSHTAIAMVQKIREIEDHAQRATPIIITRGDPMPPAERILMGEFGANYEMKLPFVKFNVISVINNTIKAHRGAAKNEIILYQLLNNGKSVEENKDTLVELQKSGIEGQNTVARYLFEEVPESAEAIVQSLKKQDERNPKYLTTAAKFYTMLQDHKSAVPLLEKADKAAPFHFERMKMLAINYAMSKNSDKAYEVYDQLIKRDTLNEHAKFNYVENLFKANANNEAIKLGRKHCDENQIIRYYNNKGINHSKSKNFEDAILCYEYAIQLAQDPAKITKLEFNLAQAKLSTLDPEQIEQAGALLKKIVKKDPTFEKASNQLSKLESSKFYKKSS